MSAFTDSINSIDDIEDKDVINAIINTTLNLHTLKEKTLTILHDFAQVTNQSFISDGESYYAGPPSPTTKLLTKAQKKTKWVLILDTGPTSKRFIKQAKEDMELHGKRIRARDRERALIKVKK